MTDNPTTKTDQTRPQESSTRSGRSAGSKRQSTAPSSISAIGASTRRNMGVKSDRASKKTDPSKANAKSAKGNGRRTGGQKPAHT